MTVGELKKTLEEFDDNLQVVYDDDFNGWMNPNPRLVTYYTDGPSGDKPFVEL